MIRRYLADLAGDLPVIVGAAVLALALPMGLLALLLEKVQLP